MLLGAWQRCGTCEFTALVACIGLITLTILRPLTFNHSLGEGAGSRDTGPPKICWSKERNCVHQYSHQLQDPIASSALYAHLGGLC